MPIVGIFERLKVPAIVGFLIAGIVIGPHGVGLIAHSEDVDTLAEIGLILLLFVVGLELSFTHLARVGRVAVWAGALQITLTTAVVAAAGWLGGLPPAESVFIGFLVVQSSTAIVLKILIDRDELHSPHGRITAGVLLVQDLCLVPLVLFTRLLAEPASASGFAVVVVLVKAAAAVAVIIVAARLILPMVLRQIVALRSRELFTGTIILFSLGTAWLASQFGLSLAIGALIAGLVISESEYSHQAIADILPFRDAFNSIFFISIGMLVHVEFLAEHFVPLVAAAVGVLAVKALIASGAILPFYPSPRVAVTAGVSLAALGEVSFVLARFALPFGLLPEIHYEAFVAVAVLTMLASPFLIAVAPLAAGRAQRLFRHGIPPPPEPSTPGGNHVVIVGYGLNGENLAHVLRQTGLPYRIVELDPNRTATARARNEPVLYGDATRPGVLHHAGIETAHVVVVAISDPVATRHIVALARQGNPTVPIIVRTRYVAEMEDLQRLGATEVVPEEYETSVEIFARVLRRLRVPRNVIGLQVDLIRRQGYRMLRGLELPRQTLDQLGQILAATTTETFLVPERSPAVGQSIRDLKLRRTTGVTIIAVVRNGQPFTNPAPEWAIAAGDILVMLGSHAQLDRAMRLLADGIEEVDA